MQATCQLKLQAFNFFVHGIPVSSNAPQVFDYTRDQQHWSQHVAAYNYTNLAIGTATTITRTRISCNVNISDYVRLKHVRLKHARLNHIRLNYNCLSTVPAETPAHLPLDVTRLLCARTPP
ncbi:hypothetical protein MTO96_007090 [Rhipicephalus appendiculatus]